MAAQWGVSEACVPAIVERGVELCNQVSEWGHHLIFLAPSRDSDCSPRAKNIAADLVTALPENVFCFSVKDVKSSYYLRWPKDGIQYFDGICAIADNPAMRSLVNYLAIKNVRSAPISEGGLFVRIPTLLLYSSAFRNEKYLSSIFRGDIRAVPCPAECSYYQSLIGEREPPMTHIDFDLCLLDAPDGRRHLLVGEIYYNVFRRNLCDVFMDFGFVIYVVPQQEVFNKGLNLVVLPGGFFLIPSGCPHLQSYLSRLFGERRIKIIEIDDTFNYNGGRGGLGCMASIVTSQKALTRESKIC